ncbi:serine-rich adhesin for platelets-like [Watersipora subatra]|uniref:serine-rich adhesin for platelets-like n=1 Tax=Watersipora subatra TaxID=2589382 RepID=UPI00355B2E16
MSSQCPVLHPVTDKTSLLGKGSRPTNLYLVTTTGGGDKSSFVSGGSRPTAPIKTAIIRPTNYYDGLRRTSIGASPDSKQNQQNSTVVLSPNDHSPEACKAGMCPLTPEAESDPLSDSGAVMYGTNATRRRKSKVEAWIESSSSAQSDESLSENRALSIPLRSKRRPAMHIASSSSTLSGEEVDLSFENLCQELLALSASCSTLERMIHNTSHEIESTLDRRRQVSENCRQQAVPVISDLLSPASTSHESTTPSSSGTSLFIEEPGDKPENAPLLARANTEPLLGSTALSLPLKKMEALTVDVGRMPEQHQRVTGVPIEGSLVTISSPVREGVAFYEHHHTSQRKLDSSVMKTSYSQNSGDPSKLDHVAVAITTQPAHSISTRTQCTAQLILRSVSEPASFVTLPPDKRASLVKSPNKKEVKGKQLLRVGMDYIRHNGSNSGPKIPSKDNMLMNNLDINQAKSTTSHSDKLTILNQGPNLGSQSHIRPPVKASIGPDSVFLENGQSNGASSNPLPPVFTSTCKQLSVQPSLSTHTPVLDHTLTTNESLSSSFESEALDILASLKSANAFKAQHRHGKFPTEVDPVTGSPRGPPLRMASEEKLKLMEGLNYTNRCQQNGGNSNKSSCLSSPTNSTPSVLHHRSPAHCQTPLSRRSRHSYYDNVLQSPFGGLRISIASGSSSGTVFSKPWGDLPRFDDYANHNDEFRHRVGSQVSSQGRSGESVNGMLSPTRSSSQKQSNGAVCRHERSRSTSCSHSGSDEQNSYCNLSSIPRFPISGLPDVTLDTDTSRQKSSWEVALDRALSRVRIFTKLLQSADNHSCEITRYTQTLLSDSNSFPGTLIGRFHTCTWETNSLDRSNHLRQTNGFQSQQKRNGRKETPPKTDWYGHNIQRNGGCDNSGTSKGLFNPAMYANGGCLANGVSTGEGQTTDAANAAVMKEHIVLSNVRQFIDGMKRFLLNRPDTQMMFAIQRERIRLDANQLINLDAIMEAVLEKVILQPLSDHLLSVITTHPDYSIREITQIENGMKTILQHKMEIFAHLQSSLSQIDSYDQTLRLVFQNLKSEFSPITKLQYLLQMAVLFLLIHNRSMSNREQDLQMLFIYAMARYGDATLMVHLAYIRHLIPVCMKGGATSYVLSLFETTVQVYSRIVKVPGAVPRRMMVLQDILDKLNCHLMIADESTNRVIRKKISLSRWTTTSELIEIIQVYLANHELSDFRLYLATDEKDVLLKANENVSEQLMAETRSDRACALVYRRPNTQMLLPPP